MDVRPTRGNASATEAGRALQCLPAALLRTALGGGNWSPKSSGSAREPLRVINYWGRPNARWGIGDEKDDDVKAGNLFGIQEGGRTILYHDEDPFIRGEYRRRLAAEGVDFTMPDSAFQPPAGVAAD